MKKQTICLSTITLTYILISAQNSFCMEWFTPVGTKKENWHEHIENTYMQKKQIANQHPYSCSLCLANHTHNPNLEVSLTKCRHTYCNKCILTWLLIKKKKCCPLCKKTPLMKVKKFANVFVVRKNNKINLFDADPNSRTSLKINKKPFTAENDQVITDEKIVDNKLFIACRRQLHIFDIESEKKIITCPIEANPNKRIKQQRFLKDDILWTRYCDDTFTLCNPTNGKAIDIITGVMYQSKLYIVCPNNKDQIVLHCLRSGNKEYKNHLPIKRLEILDHRYLVIIYENGLIYISKGYNAQSNKVKTLFCLESHKAQNNNEIKKLFWQKSHNAYSRNSYLHILYLDNTLDIHDCDKCNAINLKPILTPEIPINEIIKIIYSKKCNRLIIYTDKTAYFFDSNNGGESIRKHPIRLPRNKISNGFSFTFLTDSILLASCPTNQASLFNIYTGDEIKIKRAHFSRQHVTIMYEDNTIDIFDLDDNKKINNDPIQLETDPLSFFEIIENKLFMTRKCHREYTVYDTKTGKKITEQPLITKEAFKNMQLLTDHIIVGTYKNSRKVLFNTNTNYAIEIESIKKLPNNISAIIYKNNSIELFDHVNLKKIGVNKIALQQKEIKAIAIKENCLLYIRYVDRQVDIFHIYNQEQINKKPIVLRKKKISSININIDNAQMLATYANSSLSDRFNIITGDKIINVQK